MPTLNAGQPFEKSGYSQNKELRKGYGRKGEISLYIGLESPFNRG